MCQVGFEHARPPRLGSETGKGAAHAVRVDFCLRLRIGTARVVVLLRGAAWRKSFWTRLLERDLVSRRRRLVGGQRLHTSVSWDEGKRKQS